MGYHSFSLDPRTVLGVGRTASLDEIHEAYHAKSKKHHPGLGGDEWAFRMVVRAYEVLKTTMNSPAPRPWESDGANITAQKTRNNWAWTENTSFGDPSTASSNRNDFTEANASDRNSRPDSDDEESPVSASPDTNGPHADPSAVLHR